MRGLRPVVLTLVVLAGALLSATGAWAIKIDQELEQLLAIKVRDAKVPVLLVYDELIGSRDLIQELNKLDPKKRRKKIIAYLKRKSLKSQQNSLNVLSGRDWGDQVADIQQLYLANAIVFRGTEDVIKALAALPDKATLYHDRRYNLVAGTAISKELGVRSPAKKAAEDTAWGIKYIHADRVWKELGITGKDVVVGHIDTGVYLSHPDLAGRLWVNEGEIPDNGIDDDGNGFVDDVHGFDFGVWDGDPNDDAPNGGHGTHTAGTVVGDGTGGVITGVAPGAKIMACKVWQGDGQGGSLGMIWAAEQYCLENGAQIITMSLGIPGDIPAIFMRNDRVNCANIRNAGVLLVNSSGNEHYQYDPPLEIDLTARVPAPWSAAPVPFSSTGGVVTVGGLGYGNDSNFPSSSRGPVAWGDVDPWRDWSFDPGQGLIKPDIAAPGTNVNSTVIPEGYSGDTWSGTSMACPHVAGVATLMLEKNPSLSPAGLDSLMELSAVDIGVPGKDNIYGSGRLDAYAAVVSVPEGHSANLSLAGVLPDFDGDQVLDPGQVSPLAFQLVNVSPVADAVGLSGELTLEPDPFVTVTHGHAEFGTLAAQGGKGDNRDDPFLLSIDPEAPQGHAFTMLLTLASGEFTRTYDISWYVGLPEYRTHDAGNIYLTVTDQGSLGYMGQDGNEGQGMGAVGEASSLFIGSFWAGTGPDYVCNRDYEGLGDETSEWVVSTDKDDIGRVRDDSTGDGRQIYHAVFHDGGHEVPLALRVEQTSVAFGTPPNDDFVLLEYNLTNEGDTPITDLYAGVFCDFDVGDSAEDLGSSDPDRNLAYIFHGVGPFFGVALLDTAAAVNVTMINNPAYVYGESRINDQDKFDLLSGAVSVPVARTGDDWSLLVSTVVDLEPGESRQVAFAMLYGDNKDDLLANTDAALAAYSPEEPVTPEVPVHFVRLEQNVPNPFNPLTDISFQIPDAGLIELAVYDLRGVKVRTLFKGLHEAGLDQVSWNGTDDAGRSLPSGIYFCRLTTGKENRTRKMTLVR